MNQDNHANCNENDAAVPVSRKRITLARYTTDPDYELENDSEEEKDDDYDDDEDEEEEGYEDDDDNEELFDDVLPRNNKKGKAAATTSNKSYKALPLDELFVDWYRLADTRWGRDELKRYLSVHEMDSLVGWTYHYWTDGASMANSSAEPLFYNPLFGSLPGALDLPPRPSTVRFMIQNPTIPFSVIPRDRFNHSAAVAVALLAEEVITASLLPLAKRHVQRCRRLDYEVAQYEEAINQDNQKAPPKNKKIRLNNSTKNETGDSDTMQQIRIQRERTDRAFHEWTLPPEEAIYNMLFDSNSNDINVNDPMSIMGRGQCPTRSCAPGAPGTSILNTPTPGTREQHAHVVWCQSHKRRGLHEDLIEFNKDVFQAFLPTEWRIPNNTGDAYKTSGHKSGTDQRIATKQLATTTAFTVNSQTFDV